MTREEFIDLQISHIDDEMMGMVLSCGRGEVGVVEGKTAEEHAADLANSISLTDQEFGTSAPYDLFGVYVEGSETVLCHTGTSPNSGLRAKAMMGAWNFLHELCRIKKARLEAQQ